MLFQKKKPIIKLILLVNKKKNIKKLLKLILLKSFYLNSVLL